MLNLLSYVGMSMQSELCLWTLIGLLRTIFDATLFKVNANLKQVWQMSMPAELALPVQRALRTIISGVMIVQCFTVYFYLASYIVLLYPIFLEERPTLVLPWLLLAAVRQLLCELTSLTLGLGACLLLGPARPQCVRFLVFKVTAITPAFYMWMLVYSYYNNMKVASAFKLSPASLQSKDPDYGLELAVRRRRTKSLLHEDQLRRNLVANFNYGGSLAIVASKTGTPSPQTKPINDITSQSSRETLKCDTNVTNLQTYEDWMGNEITLPRDADRILEQFVVMLFRISAFLKTGLSDPISHLSSNSRFISNRSLELTPVTLETAEPPIFVGSRAVKNSAAYIHKYPQIFNKKQHSQSDTKYSHIQSNYFNDPKIVPSELKTVTTIRRRFTVPNRINELKQKKHSDNLLIRSLSYQSPKTTAVTCSDSDESLSEGITKTINTAVKVNIEHATDADENLKDLPNYQRELQSSDSLQSIIDRMKSSLYSNKDSNMSRSGYERSGNRQRPSTSRASNYRTERYRSEEDKKSR